MDEKRRDFIRSFGRKTAGAAAAIATPTAAFASQMGEDMKRLGSDFQQKLTDTAEELGSRIGQVGDRLDGAAVAMAYQQMQIHLIFLLLVISFVIDGGLSLSMFVFQ